MKKIKDSVIIITGASSGIGHATALRAAQLGAIPVAVARREDRLTSLIKQCQALSPQASYICADLGIQADAEGIIEETICRYGRIDTLINNAGVPLHKLIYKISANDVEQVLRVNFMSCVWSTLATIPHMLNQGGGTIVNVSSFATKVIPTHETVYAASKYAMNGFTKGLWTDLAGSGIHCALVHPGAIDTEIWGKLEEANAYSGHKHGAEIVARDILDTIIHQRLEVVSPRNDFKLKLARVMAVLAPALVRQGVLRMDPITEQQLEWAKRLASQKKL